MAGEKIREDFDTNFFNYERSQRSWDELVVGETYEFEPFVVTEERIRKYAEGTEDYNPFYIDEEAAKNSQFGGLIAPPTIVVPIKFASTPPDHWIKLPGAINPGKKLELGVPVRPGDIIYCEGKLIDKYIKRGKKYTVEEVRITNQNGELVCLWTGGLVLQYQGNPETINK